jgi:hypothetical protein
MPRAPLPKNVLYRRNSYFHLSGGCDEQGDWRTYAKKSFMTKTDSCSPDFNVYKPKELVTQANPMNLHGSVSSQYTGTSPPTIIGNEEFV